RLAQLEDLNGNGSESLNAQNESPEKSTEAVDDVMPIGQPEDEEDIRKIFLRQSSVLLKSGEKEFELGFTYLSNQLAATIYNARFRQFQLPIAFRIGILDRLEGSVSLPLIHAKQEFSFADEYFSQKASGIGDTSMGINYEIYRETVYWPDILTSLNVRAPTGEKPDEDGLSTGSGHWAGSFGLEFIKTSDPVVLFWGIMYIHEFPATHFLNDGIYKVKTGETIDYNLGFGFAVNDKISLGTQVSGSYQGEIKADGNKIPGSSGETVSLRSALTYRVSRKSFIEPSLTIGLNDETADFVIGIAASRRFGD
ncbi:MAG: transporter, partial [Deltaproteobacteria bacterium]|nr:transporter [Deltaproteobacteria bacterium]